MNKIFMAITLMFVATPVFSAEIPKELVGNYVYPNDKNACQYKNFSLTIKKTGIDANEFNCTITGNPKGSNGRYTLPVKCSSEDGSSKSNILVELKGNTLKFNRDEYLLCGSQSGISTSMTKAASQACTVGEGNAGVASYYDVTLKKVATEPIRDHDRYKFIKENEITGGRFKVLAGKLIAYDGQVSAGTYVIADEWECN